MTKEKTLQPVKKPFLFSRIHWENHPAFLSFLKSLLREALVESYPEARQTIEKLPILLQIPSYASFGDYSTNIAFPLGGVLKKNPVEIAGDMVKQVNKYIKNNQTISFHGPEKNELLSVLASEKGKLGYGDILNRVNLGGQAFINLWVQKRIIVTLIDQVLNQKEAVKSTKNKYSLLSTALSGKRVFIEFAHPNTLKEFHIGHLRNITLGESLVRLFESVGATVFRGNYESDIGMNVAKSLWGIQEKMTRENISLDHIRGLSPREKAKFLGEAYALGSSAYEDEEKKKNIIDLNKKIYINPLAIPLWKETRQWSLDYFDSIYQRLGSHFDRLFFESEVERLGRQMVIDAAKKGIFVKDTDGSIYFPGEKYGLNNCVFVTREDYATYEGKEIALEDLEYKTFPFDLSINNVANEQSNFFQIGYKATEVLFPEHQNKHFHLSYGMVKLKSGKMSSRTGKVITADWLLDEAKKRILTIMEGIKETTSSTPEQDRDEIAEKIAVGAIKYSMLRVNPLMDITFDLDESVSLTGDSGPYVLYTYARAKSVLRKSKISSGGIHKTSLPNGMNSEEDLLIRALFRFPEVVLSIVHTLSPNFLTTYLFDLSQKYNAFYNKHSILEGENSPFRLFLTVATSHIIEHGLYLLGIETVEQM